MHRFDYSYFCSSCPESQQYREANCFTSYRMEHYKAGEYIAYKGEVVTELSMLEKGSIVVETVLDSGLLLTSRVRKAPFPIGAVALFAKDNRYRVNIKAREESTFSVVSRNEIEERMVNCRTFLHSFIAYNAEMVDVFASHLSLLTHKNLRAKLAYYIFTRSKGQEFKFDKRVGELATYLCVERPSLSRAISQLVDDGIITYSRGEGKILNAQALKELLE